MTTSLIDQPQFNKTTNFSLIMANLFPIYAVLFLGWKIFDIAVFYCIETFIIGLFHMIKMSLCKQDETPTLYRILFFLAHYNGFVFVQFAFIGSYFGYPDIDVGFDFDFNPEEDDMTPVLKELFKYTYENVDYLFVGTIAIIISHAHSLVANFYLGGEYLKEDIAEFVFKPYGRIIGQQLVIAFGGGLILAVGSPLPLLVILVMLKTAVDLLSHNVSHRKIKS